MGFATDCIHAGQEPDPGTGAIITPIFQTSTYVQDELGKDKGFDYARTINPTRLACEANLAALEGGKHGVCFASGMAAISSALSLLKHGDTVVVSRNVYGGTFRVFEQVYRDFGLNFEWVDTTDLDILNKAMSQDNVRLLHVETPTNPMMEITDIAAAADIAHKNDALLMVDNTFLSPALQRPLDFGADLVVHSTTKFVNGHSDSVGGVLITNQDELAERLKFVQNSAGAILSPFDSWLILRGTKTLSVRMKAHEENGNAIAAMLADHPEVEKVHYPGLPDHPGHELAKKQQKGFGSMISFEVGTIDRARAVLNRFKLFALAESLGGVESLACHPVSMTHGAVPPETRKELGLHDALIRLSVGIEDLDDLKGELSYALEAL